MRSCERQESSTGTKANGQPQLKYASYYFNHAYEPVPELL